VKNVLFPVKPATWAAVIMGFAATSGCGYHAAYGGEDRPLRALTVGAAPARAADIGALSALLAGARRELSRQSALRGGSGYPRLVVELVRIDEVAAGIAALPGPDGASAPLARASAIGVTARAWVEERTGAPRSRDTADVRRVETVMQGSDALAGMVAYEEASRAAASRVGEALARRALGIVEPSVDPM
jgi:hypothetical protein